MKPILTLAAAAIAAAFSLGAQAVGRLADVSIFDRATGQELPVHWKDGKAYVVGRPGNEYQVVVRNRAGEDLLLVTSVDGVNVLTGEDASTRQAGYVLGAWQETRIAGWRKNLQETAAFYFTSLGDSYAARTGRPANVGVIGVALFQRKYVPPPPPPVVQEAPYEQDSPWRERQSKDAAGAEPQAKLEANRAEKRAQAPAAPASAAPLGTGHGRRENNPTRYVGFDRRSAEPVEVIAIHYDSYRNLVAQGVLSAPQAMRDPNPFPTRFVADPPRW